MPVLFVSSRAGGLILVVRVAEDVDEAVEEGRDLVDEAVDGINGGVEAAAGHQTDILGDVGTDLLLLFLVVGGLIVLKLLHQFAELVVGLVPVLFRIGSAVLLHLVDKGIETLGQRFLARDGQQDERGHHQE